MAIMEYKQKFDAHIIYFSSLGKFDRMCIFMNGLDDHIKFTVKAYSPKTIFRAYRLAINFETRNKTYKKAFENMNIMLKVKTSTPNT
jgi:hypothetical protein